MNSMRSMFGGGGGFFGGNNPFSNIMDLVRKFRQFSSNPFGELMGINPNLNIPQNISNNPQAMVQYLRNSGKMTPDEFDQCSQLAIMFNNTIGRP